MFEWVLNTPLIIVEYNLKTYLILFELKKSSFNCFHFGSFFTHEIFLYLQFIRCTFCGDFWETLNIMKFIFDKCKESARKTLKTNIAYLCWRYFQKNKQQSHFLNKTSVQGCTRNCFWFRVAAVFFSEKSWNRLPLKISKNLQASCNFPGETPVEMFLRNF